MSTAHPQPGRDPRRDHEVIDGHVRFHVLSPKAAREQRQGAEELLAIVRTYF